MPPVDRGNSTSALVAMLRARANELPADATEASALLSKYATEIERSSESNKALMDFNAIAMHYKGLKDMVVPGVPDSEWLAFVNKFRKLCTSALRENGLDKSPLGRLHALLRGISVK